MEEACIDQSCWNFVSEVSLSSEVIKGMWEQFYLGFWWSLTFGCMQDFTVWSMHPHSATQSINCTQQRACLKEPSYIPSSPVWSICMCNTGSNDMKNDVDEAYEWLALVHTWCTIMGYGDPALTANWSVTINNKYYPLSGHMSIGNI